MERPIPENIDRFYRYTAWPCYRCDGPLLLQPHPPPPDDYPMCSPPKCNEGKVKQQKIVKTLQTSIDEVFNHIEAPFIRDPHFHA